MQSTEVEIWKPVVGYEGYYDVSSQGRVRSVERLTIRSDGSALTIPQAIKKQHLNKRDQYLQVGLCRDGRSKTYRVHVLVANAFLERPAGDVEVCHGYLGSMVNAVNNLRWDTHHANVSDAIRQGTFCRGQRRPQSKLTDAIVSTARIRHAAGESALSIASEFGVHWTTMGRMLRGETWRHVR